MSLVLPMCILLVELRMLLHCRKAWVKKGAQVMLPYSTRLSAE